MNTLREVCKNKTIKEIWESEEVDKVKKELREKLQEKLNKWSKKDHKRHIPVYISLKPKIKVKGRYFAKSRGNGSIVIYPIQALSYPITNFIIMGYDDMLLTLKHEYTHHLTRDIPHGEAFQRNFRKVLARG